MSVELVVMFHVLEHVPDPVDALRAVPSLVFALISWPANAGAILQVQARTPKIRIA